MDSKGPINPSAQGSSFIFVIIDAFSLFVVSNPAPHIFNLDLNLLIYNHI